MLMPKLFLCRLHVQGLFVVACFNPIFCSVIRPPAAEQIAAINRLSEERNDKRQRCLNGFRIARCRPPTESRISANATLTSKGSVQPGSRSSWRSVNTSPRLVGGFRVPLGVRPRELQV